MATAVTAPLAVAPGAVAAGRELNATEPEAGEAVAPSETGATPASPENPTWPDDAVESAFLAEAKERGEIVAPPKPAEDAGEDEDPKAMPGVTDLVAKIPPNIRDALEDLFRAKFVRVVRVPKKALKT